MSYKQQSIAPMQNNPNGSQQDMSAYWAANMPRTPPKGARVNDLSGAVPANQVWAQAYNQASPQGGSQAQSWTMPGVYKQQSFNPTTATFSEPTHGQSWDGNLAYNDIDSRPGPVTATSTGIGGGAMPWQEGMAQREAFVGSVIDRLGQYTGGQANGPVGIDRDALLRQADKNRENGTFVNPFASPAPRQQAAAPQETKPPASQYGREVQSAMGSADRFMRGTQWQNPFGDGARENTPRPTWSDYNPIQPANSNPMARSPATWSDIDLAAANRASGGQYQRDPATGRVLTNTEQGTSQNAASLWDRKPSVNALKPASAAQPIAPRSTGYKYR